MDEGTAAQRGTGLDPELAAVVDDLSDGAAPDSAEGAEADEPGVVTTLGQLPEAAILSEAALARIFGRHPYTVRRAVDRGELPQPIRLFGRPVWTVRAVVAHIEARLAAAATEREQLERRLARMAP